MTTLKQAHVFSCFCIPVPASGCAAILRNINVHPPPLRSCVSDKNLPGLFFLLSAALNHLQLRLQQPPFRHMRSKQIQVRLDSLTRAFACANTRADVMRVCTPCNMVPIMCLSFTKLEQYSTMTDKCCAHRGIYGHMYRKMNELAEQHHYCHRQMSQMISASFFNISQEQGQCKRQKGIS